MKIFEDVTSRRKAVSFGPSTTPSRKPLQPRNHQTPMNGFGRPLKKGTPFRKKVKELTVETKDIEKENQHKTSTTPNSAQSLRRALRATVTQRQPLGKRSGGAALGPPQRVVAKTPNSLLRTELDTEDESFEDSLLVSPPGALWNVLDTSSTRLMVVSPQAALQIGERLSTGKKHQKSLHENDTSVFSPPLETQTLTTSAKVEVTANNEKTKQNLSGNQISNPLNIEETKIEGPSDLVISDSKIKGRGKGVCMDLSEMFSGPTRRNELQSEKKVSPPPHLLKRLQKEIKSKEKAVNLEFKKVSKLKAPRAKARNIPRKVSSKKQNEAELSGEKAPEAIEPQKRGAGICMDMSSMFSPSGTKMSTPPPGLLKRLQKDPKAVKAVSGAVEARQETAQKIEDKAEVAETPAMEIPTKMPELVKGQNGVSMDMSHIFSDSTNQQQEANPLLIKRLEKRQRSEKSENRATTEQAEPQVSSTKNTERRERRAITKGAVLLPLETRETTVDESGSTLFAKQLLTGPSMGPKNDNKISRHKYSTPRAAQYRGNAPVSKRSNRKTQSNARRTKMANNSLLPHADVQLNNNWAEKQCETFAGWLNYTFHPIEDDDDNNEAVSGGSSNRNGLRTLLIHRRSAQIRTKAAELFFGESMRKVKGIIQSEIARGRLSMRSDRDISADLGLRKQAITLLLSYTTPWLRVGLEVMFGECIEGVGPNPDNAGKTVSQLRSCNKLSYWIQILID